MLRVLTLGGLTLECPERPLVAAELRPQGLGLLARLAAAGDLGVSREKLIGCFWAEKEERAALHSLSQALHRLRTELDVGEVVLGTRILRLDPRQITSDVADIAEAHRSGDFLEVVRLYAGPFLDGIYFTGVAELERWIENERRHLSEMYAGALRHLAAEAAAVGDHDTAAQRWRSLLSEDPLDGRIANNLVRSLAAAGDEAGALREAKLHRALLRTELHVDPDVRLSAFIHQHESGHGETGPSKPVASGDGRITADELCARARQCLYSFTRDAFLEGIRYAERAIQLRHDHAEAHATLGSLYIGLSQAEREGCPRARGIGHCRQAAALAPALSEPRLWWAWALQLDERFEEAERLALEGLALDPNGLFAHSTVAWVRLNWGLASGRWDLCTASAASFTRALEIDPHEPHMCLALAALQTLAGEYEAALPLLDRAVEIEGWVAGEMRTVGALTMQGLATLHAGRLDLARERLNAAVERYEKAPQIYTPYVNALTFCGLGDLERMNGRCGDAASSYMRGRAELDVRPALIGCGHLAVRLETRLASVFRRLRMRQEEERHARQARLLTATRPHYSFNWCWGVSEAELHYDWAVYHAECADREAMLASLKDAAGYGWRELSLLDVDPAFAFSRDNAEMKGIVEWVRGLPGL